MKNIKKVIGITAFCLFFASFLMAQPQKKKDFNFWVGEWNVYKYGTDTLVGKSSITSIMDGYALLEQYHAAKSNYQGTSINKYNENTSKWEQYYVDNSGLTLHLRGTAKEGKMVLENSVTRGKKDIKNKIVWESLGKKGIRQTWYQMTKASSNDENDDEESEMNDSQKRKWTVIFDGIYKSKAL